MVCDPTTSGLIKLRRLALRGRGSRRRCGRSCRRPAHRGRDLRPRPGFGYRSSGGRLERGLEKWRRQPCRLGRLLELRRSPLAKQDQPDTELGVARRRARRRSRRVLVTAIDADQPSLRTSKPVAANGDRAAGRVPIEPGEFGASPAAGRLPRRPATASVADCSPRRHEAPRLDGGGEPGWACAGGAPSSLARR